MWTQDDLRRRRGELPRRAPATASTPRLYWPGPRRGHAPTSWCCAACCRWPTRGCERGASSDAVRDRYLGVIEGRCKTGRNGADVADPGRRSGSRRRACDRAERAAPDARLLPRAHAHQRAGAHLAAALTPAVPLATRYGRVPAYAGPVPQPDGRVLPLELEDADRAPRRAAAGRRTAAPSQEDRGQHAQQVPVRDQGRRRRTPSPPSALPTTREARAATSSTDSPGVSPGGRRRARRRSSRSRAARGSAPW